MFTQQHYKKVAELFKSVSYDASKRFFVELFCEMFAQDNLSFQKEKFIGACFTERKK